MNALLSPDAIAEWPNPLLQLARQGSANGHHHEPVTISAALGAIKPGERDTWFWSIACKSRAMDAPLSFALAVQEQLWKETPQPEDDYYPLEAALEKIERAYRTYPPGVTTHADLPSFPAEVLPGSIRLYDETVAAALNCPLDFAVLPLLTLAGAAIGNTRAVEIKKGWIEYPIIWTVFVAPPGSAKTAALSKAKLPLLALQRAAKEAYDRQYAEWEAAKKTEADAGPEPRLTHYWSNDATPEALGAMLEHSAGVALIIDELSGFLAGMDRYKSKAGNELQRYLSTWSADDWKIDRRAKGGSILIENPVVPITGGIQPDMLATLAHEAGRRDGFLERFLIAYPRADVALWTETEIPDDLVRAVSDRFAKLRFAGSGIGGVQADRPLIYRLSSEAKQRFTTFYNDHKLRASEASGVTAGIYAKADTQLARIALILHVLDETAGREIPGETMERAITLTDYLLTHTCYAVSLISPDAQQERVLDILKERGDWMSTTDIRDALNRNLYGSRLRAILASLETSGRVEHRRNEDTGGRASAEWRAVHLTAEEGTTVDADG